VLHFYYIPTCATTTILVTINGSSASADQKQKQGGKKGKEQFSGDYTKNIIFPNSSLVTHN